MVANGCSLHGDCLSCPLPLCQYDMSNADRRKAVIYLRAMPLLDGSTTVRELAQQHVVTERAVYRWQRAARELQRLAGLL